MSSVAFRRTVQEIAQVRQVSKISYLTAAAQLTTMQGTVHVTANTTYDSWTLTLPAVSEASGLIFSIRSTIANQKAVTVTDAGDDSAFQDLTLDTDGDYAVLYSDGVRWLVLLNGIA